MDLSVIIPALDEADLIGRTLESVAAQAYPAEVIVVDGGSVDGTCALAAAHARVITARRGRARQMNAGARHASGDVLLFLHADTVLPPQAFDAVRRTLADPRATSGIFRLRFDHTSPLLRFYSLCTRLPVARLAFGDRALFVRRSVFEAEGGFPAVPLFEDVELVRCLHRTGGFRFLPQHVTTSARRFDRVGAFRQQLLNAYLWTSYMLGRDLEALAPLYRYDG